MVNPNFAWADFASPLKSESGASMSVPHCSQTRVAVDRAGQVVRGRPVAEVRVHHHAESLELLEVAVDRRDVDVGILGLDLERELLGRPVARGGEEGTQQEAA